MPTHMRTKQHLVLRVVQAFDIHRNSAHAAMYVNSSIMSFEEPTVASISAACVCAKGRVSLHCYIVFSHN